MGQSQMATKLGVILADFSTQLATAISVGGTTATLQSALDDDGIALPAGRYFFTIDGTNSNKEHFSCVLSGTSLTSLASLSRQGVETSGAVRAHRLGSTVSLTDFAHIKFVNDLLIGTTNLNSLVPLSYDGIADMTGNDNKLASVAFVKATAIAGGADASSTIKGITKLSVNPVSTTSPIAVGDNDTRVPTVNQTAALVGTSGTATSGANKLVDNADTSATASAGKVIRANGSGTIDSSFLPSSFAQNFTADSGITGGNAVIVTDGTNVTRSTITPTNTAGIVAVSGSTSLWGAQAFTVPSENNLYVQTITARLDQNTNGGQPTATLTLSIRATSAGQPTGTDLASATVSHSAFGVNQSVQFTFATPVVLTAGVTYSYLIRTSNATGNSYQWYCDFSSANAGSTWSSSSGSGQSFSVVFGKVTTAGRVMQTNATTSNIFANNFIGFAAATTLEAATCSVVHTGIVTGLSGLTVGSVYFLSNTPGAISTSAGSVSKKVGIAISTTALLIRNDNS